MRSSFKQATEADRGFAESLHEQCYKEVVIAQFGSWDSTLQKHFFAQQWHPQQYRIIVCEGEEIGVLATENKPDHLFLSEIQIHPSHQGKGLGSAILTDLLAHARAQKLPVHLKVLRHNRAQTLYERMGFICYGQTDTHLLYKYENNTAKS